MRVNWARLFDKINKVRPKRKQCSPNGPRCPGDQIEIAGIGWKCPHWVALLINMHALSTRWSAARKLICRSASLGPSLIPARRSLGSRSGLHFHERHAADPRLARFHPNSFGFIPFRASLFLCEPIPVDDRTCEFPSNRSNFASKARMTRAHGTSQLIKSGAREEKRNENRER